MIWAHLLPSSFTVPKQTSRTGTLWNDPCNYEYLLDVRLVLLRFASHPRFLQIP